MVMSETTAYACLLTSYVVHLELSLKMLKSTEAALSEFCYGKDRQAMIPTDMLRCLDCRQDLRIQPLPLLHNIYPCLPHLKIIPYDIPYSISQS